MQRTLSVDLDCIADLIDVAVMSRDEYLIRLLRLAEARIAARIAA